MTDTIEVLQTNH